MVFIVESCAEANRDNIAGAAHRFHYKAPGQLNNDIAMQKKLCLPPSKLHCVRYMSQYNSARHSQCPTFVMSLTVVEQSDACTGVV